MKNTLEHPHRPWLAAALVLVAALACGGGVQTEVPPRPVSPEPKDVTPTPLEPSAVPTTGTIRGLVELVNISTGPLAETVVEVAGWEESLWAETDAQGLYQILEVPPGVHMVVPQASSGLTSYQAVNVVAGGTAVADFRILTAQPLVISTTIEATVRVDGAPASGAYLWVARSNDVYLSDENGAVRFVYGSARGSPAIVVHADRWDILEVPLGIEHWDIDLSRTGAAPPLPADMVLIEPQVVRAPIPLVLLLPTPFELVIVTGLRTQEDCISFEGSKAALENVGGGWRIVAGDISLLDFGVNQQEAQQALKIFQTYGFNQQCFVGRPDPSMEYYLIDGAAPSGSIAGEDCLGFSPGAAQVEQVGGHWKITEGNQILMDFADQEAEAQNAYKIIQKYEFDESCFVGRPDPSLVYFRQ